MALSGTVIIEVRNGGSDTLNGGLFNPGATLNSNLAATSATGSAPVVTSATYNFVAGDVGAWLFVKSGTNWTPGWYQIASVAANAATLSAGVGQAILYSAVALGATGFNTVAGVATTASPTSGSWAVDYSQQDAVQNSLTGLSTAAANAIILTASATVAMVGNGVVITGGTNFTTGVYQINSVSAGVSITVDRTCTTAAGASGTAGVGGALASPGFAGSLATVAGIKTFVKYHATVYTATSASTNIAAGCVLGTTNTYWAGYDSSRWLLNYDTNRPTFKIGSAVSSATLFIGTNNTYLLNNFILDGNNQTSSRGSLQSGFFWRCKAINCNTGGLIQNTGTAVAVYCEATACSTTVPISVNTAMACQSYANTVSGMTTSNGFGCISYANSGGSSSGIVAMATTLLVNCVAYNNGLYGFDTGNNVARILNSVAESNANVGYFVNAGTAMLEKCASYLNTSGRSTSGGLLVDSNPVVGSGSFFVDAANGNFALNNTSGAGALLRGLGFPALFPAGLTASYPDIGAAQHLESNPVGQVVKVASIGTY